jgi:hypothetical protein
MLCEKLGSFVKNLDGSPGRGEVSVLVVKVQFRRQLPAKSGNAVANLGFKGHGAILKKMGNMSTDSLSVSVTYVSCDLPQGPVDKKFQEV